MPSKLILKQNGMESNFFPYIYLWTKPNDVEHAISKLKLKELFYTAIYAVENFTYPM